MSSRATPTAPPPATPQRQQPDPQEVQARHEAALQLWLLNIVFGVFLGLAYLEHVPEHLDSSVWWFAFPALVSSIVTLGLLPGIGFTIWARRARSLTTFGIVHGVVWAFLHTLLYADTRVFNQFRYHFNGQVLGAMFIRGSEDAVYLGWTVWSSVISGLVLVTLAELWLWNRLLHRARGDHERVVFKRPAMVCCVLMLPAVVVEKSIYAAAAIDSDPAISHLSNLFPLYPNVPVADLASVVTGEEARRPRIEVEGVALDYPHSFPELDPDGERPNFLFVVVDCLRQDVVTPENAPAIHAFAETSRRFENHLSCGNSTRYGVFGMLYGLHGTYWFPVLNERRSPVLVDLLLEADYDVQVFSSANMHFPELRSTAWVGVQDEVHDDFPGEVAWQRDEQAAAACIEWLEEREQSGDERPFFCFLMLDSPHQNYSHPPGATPFEPSAAELDYMQTSAPDSWTDEVVEAVFNRYRNAVHHSDRVAGTVLDKLEQLELTDETLVTVTGDHGEEFLENGFFGHTSTFGPYQLRVPFFLRGPGVTPGIEARPTSHIDIPATLGEILGTDPATRAEWTLGENLFAPREERRRVAGGWNELGMWTPDGILRLLMRWGAFDVEVYDDSWNFVPDDHGILEREARPLENLAAECNRFLR